MKKVHKRKRINGNFKVVDLIYFISKVEKQDYLYILIKYFITMIIN